MARTKGSGWGAGTILYQECPICHKNLFYSEYSWSNVLYKCKGCNYVELY